MESQRIARKYSKHERLLDIHHGYTWRHNALFYTLYRGENHFLVSCPHSSMHSQNGRSRSYLRKEGETEIVGLVHKTCKLPWDFHNERISNDYPLYTHRRRELEPHTAHKLRADSSIAGIFLPSRELRRWHKAVSFSVQTQSRSA